MNSSRPAISLGAQAGGPRHGGLAQIKVDLDQALSRHVSSTHCNVVDEYAPVLRISGPICDFGPEAITRVRFAKARRYITADIQIPESVWKPKLKNELRDYLAKKIVEIMPVFADRLEAEKATLDRPLLLKEVQYAIDDFRTIDYDT